MHLLVLVLEDLIQPQQLLVEEGQLILVIVDEVLVVPELHDGDLVLLALLLVVVDLSIAVFKQLSALPDLVLKGGSLVLEADGHLSDLAVDHRLPLAFHHVPEVLELLGLALLGGLVARFPLFYFLREVVALVLLCLVLLLEGEVNITELVLEHLVLVVEGFADLIEFLVLLAVLVDLLLLGETALGELADLYLVVGGVEELAFVLLEPDAEDLYFLREALNLDGLEHHDKLYVLSEVGLLVVGEVLDARPWWSEAYLRRSSP